MKNIIANRENIFRPVDFWKSAVMTMPDNSFFELMRSVFGKIKTPFKKQQLINDLESFLLREDIQKTIISYIDENDAKIIAAVALYSEPAFAELESFFSGEFSYSRLHDIIVNLEERFIIYRFTDEDTKSPYKNRLALNPVLEKPLLVFALNTQILFPAAEIEDKQNLPSSAAARAFIFDDRIFAGLFSYVNNSVIKSRKRLIEKGKQIFPAVDLDLLIGGLQILGLFFEREENLVPDNNLWNNFGSLSARERKEYCAASMIVYNESKPFANILPPLYRSKVREIAGFINYFIDSLEEGLLYSEKTLIRLAEIIKAKTFTVINNKTLFEFLEKAGLLVTVIPEIRQLAQSKTAVQKHGTDNKVFIASDSGFSFIVFPGIKYSDALNIASVLNVREAGTVVRFELDKDSAVRAFDNKTGADKIIGFLERLSGSRIDENLAWTLKDWEKSYSEVSLKKGVILTLCEDRRYLVNTKAIAGLISETICDGVYLLPENKMDEARFALRHAGIDIISQPQKKTEYSGSNYFSSLDNNYKLSFINNSPENENLIANINMNTDDLIEEFREILFDLPLDDAVKTELSARIERKLVLCEDQLKNADLRYEKLEARNMDYNGKLNIAKQAVSLQSPVEIVWQGRKKGERIFGIPKSIEKGKTKDDLVLLIIPEGEEEELRIPLAKISLIRRIKKSIFEI